MAHFKPFLSLLPWVIILSLPAQPAPSADTPQSENAPYVLGPDDQIKIWALGMEEISDKPVRIDPAGNIDLAGVGQVHAGDLTVEQLRATLIERFSKLILHPQVSIEIVDFGSQPVSVMGAVNHPGIHQLHGRKTLVEVLSLADGLRPEAGPHVTISREIRYGPIPLFGSKLDSTGQFSVAVIDAKELLSGFRPAENILICPHDVITVSAPEVIYVIGEVKKPGEVPLRDRGSISVLQALASAQGYGATPAPQNSKIVRTVPGSQQRVDIPVDLTKIMAGKAEDIALRPNDILMIPVSGPKKLATRLAEAAIQAATGIAIWGRP
jgi:polysaccharide export outer membrane protein